jgi:hypothetical protein
MLEKQNLEELSDVKSITNSRVRKRKFLLYAVGISTLLILAGYFIRQFNQIMAGKNLSLSPPTRVERLDTTGMKPADLTRVYELEEKNRHRDSLSLSEQEKAMQYIIMDWENLYDIRKKKAHNQPATPTGKEDTLTALLGTLHKDSSQLAAHTTVKEKVSSHTRNRKRQTIGVSKQLNKSRPVAEKQLVGTADLFNTVYNQNNPILTRSVDTTGMVAGNRQQTTSLIAASVYGDHKIRTGSKVTFRTLEEITINGVRLPRNSLIVAIAGLNAGRISFNSFRTKLGNSNFLLPFSCYDSDMIAGISYADQNIMETEVRKSSADALTDAANNLSYTIPYAGLARATSSIARGIIRGGSRNREMFIYLSDGYKVFLELQKK